jgi:hypothetical protein
VAKRRPKSSVTKTVKTAAIARKPATTPANGQKALPARAVERQASVPEIPPPLPAPIASFTF